jgi:hypothetical protein
MVRSEEAEEFFNLVYSAVQEIPHGKVTTYGHIAKLVDEREFDSFITLPVSLAPSWLPPYHFPVPN